MQNKKKMDDALIARIYDNDSTLTDLNLSSLPSFTNHDMRKLGLALSFDNSVIRLDLSLNTEPTNMGAVLKDVFTHNKTLTHLNLRGNDIGDDGVQALAGALQTNNSLISLDLGDNQIGGNGASELAVLLQSKQSKLTFLRLDHNFLSYNGVKNIAKALEENKSLTFLDLSVVFRNPLYGKQQEQVIASFDLANALQKNKSLTGFSFRHNGITEHGAKAFSAMLKNNTTLKRLNLSDNLINNIGPNGADFIDALTKNEALTVLELSKNAIDIGQLAVVLKMRKRELFTLDVSGVDYNKQSIQVIVNATLYNSTIRFIGAGQRELDKRQKQIKYRNAANAAITIFLLSTKSRSVRFENNNPTDDIETIMKFVRQFPTDLFVRMAWEIWGSRNDPKWLFDAGVEEAREGDLKKQKTTNACIACPMRIGLFVEENNPKNIFCSSYCQFIHHHNLPDVRGMTPSQINNVLQYM